MAQVIPMPPLGHQRLVEQHFALDAVGDRCGEHLAARQVVLGVVVLCGVAVDRHPDVGRVAGDDADLVGGVENLDHLLLVLADGLPVFDDRVPDERLVGVGAHLGVLGVRRRGVLRPDPALVQHDVLQLLVDRRVDAVFFGVDVARLEGVRVRPDADGDVGLLDARQGDLGHADVLDVDRLPVGAVDARTGRPH